MRYIVRSNGETSDDLESAIGVLIDDPSFPTLGNTRENHLEYIRTFIHETSKTRSMRVLWARIGMRDMLKDVAPAVARLLYTTRFDALLCHGADAVSDIDDCVKDLEKIPSSFLQRTLGLSRCGIHTP
ncbi:unnamed protein product [Peniophora sp. CBMAI 1063]|nr:unnamed protein product [Peniophora sp. CBMAI 1063]